MTFPMMLPVTLLFMLMILLSNISVTRHPNLNLACNTIDWVRKLLVNFIAGKTQLVQFDWSNDPVASDVTIDGSILK